MLCASECWRGVWEHHCWHLSLGAEPQGTKALFPCATLPAPFVSLVPVLSAQDATG